MNETRHKLFLRHFMAHFMAQNYPGKTRRRTVCAITPPKGGDFMARHSDPKPIYGALYGANRGTTHGKITHIRHPIHAVVQATTKAREKYVRSNS